MAIAVLPREESIDDLFIPEALAGAVISETLPKRLSNGRQFLRDLRAPRDPLRPGGVVTFLRALRVLRGSVAPWLRGEILAVPAERDAFPESPKNLSIYHRVPGNARPFLRGSAVNGNAQQATRNRTWPGSTSQSRGCSRS